MLRFQTEKANKSNKLEDRNDYLSHVYLHNKTLKPYFICPIYPINVIILIPNIICQVYICTRVLLNNGCITDHRKIDGEKLYCFVKVLCLKQLSTVLESL